MLSFGAHFCPSYSQRAESFRQSRYFDEVGGGKVGPYTRGINTLSL